MDRFTALFMALDTTTKTTTKLAALQSYFSQASEADTLWALWLLSGNTLRRAVTTTQLKDWAAEAAGIPRWLFDEGYIRVGDLGEAVSLVLTPTGPSQAGVPLATWMEEIAGLRDQPEMERRRYIEAAWQRLDQPQRFIFTKLITGSFRVGVSRALTVRALAAQLDIDGPTLLHALTGNWDPRDTTLARLQAMQGTDIHPYPFFLASPIGDIAQLGDVADWQFEWKWDGIRGQLLRRGGKLALWSRGEELVSEQFPEIMHVAASLADGTVLDGEIMPWRDGPLAFAVLQTRLGRKVISPKVLQDAPVAFVTYDILEHEGQDLRDRPLRERRALLEALVARTSGLQLSPLVHAGSWDEFATVQAQARTRKAEGLMLKRLDSPYRAGRVRGDWWKWKVAPLSVDAVMINAQRGHGRRSGVYSDYTFAVRDGDQLVPFAKAYSGLTDAEINRVDAFVKRHTLEKFGPVRSVKPTLVFEIGFEGIAASNRHKSGVAVRFPRILRWREDKPASEIDTVETLQALLKELS
jgi:DNA ligase 1